MLKPYMVFSREGGSRECAELVFAHSVQEARVIGWKYCSGDFTDDYLDFSARLIRKAPWIFLEKSNDPEFVNKAHHVVDVRSCSICDCWGHSPIGDDGLCEDCREK